MQHNPVGRIYNMFRITSNWNENTATWNNQPSYSNQVSSSSIVPSTYSWMKWDVTNDVQKFIASTLTNHGWKITDDTYCGGANILLF